MIDDKDLTKKAAEIGIKYTSDLKEKMFPDDEEKKALIDQIFEAIAVANAADQ